MPDIAAAFFGSIGTVAVCAMIAFAIWMDYRKKKDERDTAHQERLKALELGYAPSDAEIQRARVYASAAWAAGVIGLVVPIVVVSLATAGTIVAIIFHHEGEPILTGLIVGWAIAGFLTLVTIVRSLNVIRQLPRPDGDAKSRAPAPGKRGDSSSAEFQEKRLEL